MTVTDDLDRVLRQLPATHDDDCSARELALKGVVLELDRTSEQLGDTATYEDFLVDVAHRLATLGYGA